MNKISVIIPTFNRESYLKRCLQSVYNQSHPADEVIVVDDGSSDHTEEIVLTNFRTARYIYQKNRGISAARNLGISKAKNNWLAFLDSDDEWLPNKLAIQIDALSNKNDYLVCHSDEIWIRNGVRVNPMNKHMKSGGEIYKSCLQRCVISPSSIILHRTVLDEIGLFDESLPACEDYDLWLRLCSKYPVLYCNEKLLNKYGGHDDQLSRQHWGMDRFRIYALDKIIKLGQLKEDDRIATIAVLLNKLKIFTKGAHKRQKQDDTIQYEVMLSDYRQKYDELTENNIVYCQE